MHTYEYPYQIAVRNSDKDMLELIIKNTDNKHKIVRISRYILCWQKYSLFEYLDKKQYFEP